MTKARAAPSSKPKPRRTVAGRRSRRAVAAAPHHRRLWRVPATRAPPHIAARRSRRRLRRAGQALVARQSPLRCYRQAAATGGAYVLQIGAYKSQADADAAWKAYKAKHAALLSGYSDDVQQADLGDKGTWYRLRIAGFPTRTSPRRCATG